jgi:hypothetical protein
LPPTRVPKYRSPSTWVPTPLKYRRPRICLDSHLERTTTQLLYSFPP